MQKRQLYIRTPFQNCITSRYVWVKGNGLHAYFLHHKLFFWQFYNFVTVQIYVVSFYYSPVLALYSFKKGNYTVTYTLLGHPVTPLSPINVSVDLDLFWQSLIKLRCMCTQSFMKSILKVYKFRDYINIYLCKSRDYRNICIHKLQR